MSAVPAATAAAMLSAVFSSVDVFSVVPSISGVSAAFFLPLFVVFIFPFPPQILCPPFPAVPHPIAAIMTTPACSR